MDVYRHSGRGGLEGVPVAAGIGMAGALGLGIVYAYALNYIPAVQASVLATLGLGFGVGACVGWGAKLGKIRNNVISGALGVICGFVALYMAWAFDPLARFGGEGFVAWDPSVIAQYMKLGAEEGLWSVGRNGDPVTGQPLALIWIAEALIIVGCAAGMAHHFTSGQLFCEACDQWTICEKGIARLAIPEGGCLALTELAQGKLAALSEFEAAEPEQYPHLRIDLNSCPQCNESNYVTFQRVELTKDGNGNPAEQAKPVLRNVWVAAEDVPELRMAGYHVEREELSGAEEAMSETQPDTAEPVPVEV